MTLHTYLLADRIAANHHHDLIHSAVQRNLNANRRPAFDRRRIALPTVATWRGLVSLRLRRRNEFGDRRRDVGVPRHGLGPQPSVDVPDEPIADLTLVN